MMRLFENAKCQVAIGCRPRLLSSLTLIFAVGCLLAACQTVAVPASGTGSASFTAGSNTIGEQCRIVASPPGSEGAQVQSAYKVYCGSWEEPSAHILLARDGKDPLELAARGWWRDRLEGTVNCGTPVRTSILDGVEAVAIDCRFRAGGWPYQALAVKIGDKIFLADSIPATYPVVERALGVLSGRLTSQQATAEGKVSSEINRLEALLAGSKYSAGDLRAYNDLLRLAQYYNFQENFAEAEQRYVRALDLQHRALPGSTGEQGFLDMHIALELSNQERFNAADVLFDRAQAGIQSSTDPTDEARLLSYRAIHLANQRKDDKALELARKATAIRRQVAKQYGYDASQAAVRSQELVPFNAPGPISGGGELLSGRAATALGDVAQSRCVEGAMLIELGRLDEAGKALDEALSIMRQEPRVPRRWLPQIRLLQARIAEQKGDWARAENLLLESIEVQHSLFGESRTEGLAYMALGRAYAEQNRLPQAFEAFHKGLAITGKTGAAIRLDQAAPFFRTGLAEAERNPEQRPRIFSEMFEVAQMVRGSTVSQTMALTAARLAASEQDVGKLIRSLQDARYERDRLREQLTLAQSDPRVLAPQVADLEKRWQIETAKSKDLERQVQAAAPRYNQLLDAPVSAKDLLGVLRPGEALVQILPGTKSSYGFLADSNGITAYKIDLTEQEAKQYVRKLRYPVEAAGKLPQFPVSDAHALYERLFSPVAGRLAAAKHVIVVSSGPFLSLPFGVLVVESPGRVGRTDYSEVPWMALRHPLTLAPSVQSFVNLRTAVRPSQASSTFIGFGDFVPIHDSSAILEALGMPNTCRQEANLIANLPALPGTALELKDVAAALGAPDSSLVLGNAFSETSVRKANLENYRIVYFATHGLLPHKLRCLPEPALVLSKPPKDAEQADGLLTTSNIVELNLDADLVVLSACDTGGPGEETGGESLSGLARAFFYSGARSLLVTHWEIPDKPTVKLLTTSFERLSSQNVTLAQALQEGQAELIKNPGTSHPLAWGAFTIVGDGGQTFKLKTVPPAKAWQGARRKAAAGF